VAYPRSCGFAWSKRGHLVTFSFHKYDYTKLDNKTQIEGQKSVQQKFPKEIKGTDFDWKFYFESRHYFRKKYNAPVYGINGSVLDGARTQGQGLDDFGHLTVNDQSVFFMDNQYLRGEATRTIGEETS
jgi:hypothetical protein